MSWSKRTIIVPEPFVEAARAACAALAGSSGTGMFIAQLSANGSLPATHYISAGCIEQDFADLLPLTTVTYAEDGTPTVTTRPGDAATVTALATAAGLVMSAADVGALLTAADVSGQEPFSVIARLGLSLCQDLPGP